MKLELTKNELETLLKSIDYYFTLSSDALGDDDSEVIEIDRLQTRLRDICQSLSEGDDT